MRSAVELVDLTPDDLIQRLKEGKVYVPKQAERALAHFFSPANLTALRELALRRTAERVDEQLLGEMQARAIPGPWAAGERILVCVSEDPRAAGLVRYTKRLADRLHAVWTALYVETKRSQQLTEEERDRVADTLRLAQALGGEAVTIPVMIARGATPGPVLWLHGCVHGDEYCGAFILHEAFRSIDPGALAGAVVALPVLNITASQRGQRMSPFATFGHGAAKGCHPSRRVAHATLLRMRVE